MVSQHSVLTSHNFKMERIALVTFFLWSLATCSVGQQHNCSFPDVLNLEYDATIEHTWRFLSPDPTYTTEHKTGQWYIHVTTAYVSHGSGADDYDSRDGYDFECIEKVGKDKMLVKRMDIDGTDRFTCVQFIKRSEIVLQIKMAEYATTADASLCDDGNLKNNDTTLVHFHSAMWHKVLQGVPYMTCSLDGGFMITHWYDKDGTAGCPNDVNNALRIEDECDKGSGLHIIRETENCPSPLHDIDLHKEPLMCIASWSDDSYTYSVATDDWNNFFVCLRMPKNRGDNFDMYIFLDGLCDSTPDVSRSTAYRKLSLKRFPVPDLCADASPHCSLLSLDKCTGNAPDLCRDTCKVCPTERSWHSKTLPQAIQQDWLMKTNVKNGIQVKISDRAIQYPDLGTWRYFGPSPCNRTRVGHQKDAMEYVLVSTSSNGCLPRVANAMINQFSESVIGVEISQSSPAQLPLSVNKTAVWFNDMSSMCPKTMYLDKTKRVGDSFRTSSFGWRNLVTEKANARLDQCNLFDEEKFHINLNTGEKCHASLEMKPLKDSFDMTVEKCDSENQTSIPGGLNKKVRYECLASFKDLQGWGTYIITRTTGEEKSVVNETYLCWYLDQRRDGYIMPVSDCNDMTATHISLDEKEPLARVRFARVATTADPTGNAATFSISMLLMLATTVLLTVKL